MTSWHFEVIFKMYFTNVILSKHTEKLFYPLGMSVQQSKADFSWHKKANILQAEVQEQAIKLWPHEPNPLVEVLLIYWPSTILSNNYNLFKKPKIKHSIRNLA